MSFKKTIRSAMVIARRDLTAIIFSKAFLFFLIGPLFPVVVGIAAGSLGEKVADDMSRPVLGYALSEADNTALAASHQALARQLEDRLPEMRQLAVITPDGQAFDAGAALAKKADGNGPTAAAVWTGSLEKPVLTGPQDQIERWKGAVSVLSSHARTGQQAAFPEVALQPITVSAASAQKNRVLTAQIGQMALFLLTMLLAGMVLSNMVEEKANKIIEILAAAIPVDAIFLGKLFAMLAMALLGISVWTGVAGSVAYLGQSALPTLTAPAVGWPLFLLLGLLYFSMAYLLLGSMFLGVGAMANTVREVQTLSMPVSMAQLIVFFFVSFTVTKLGEPMEVAATIIPFSSPFAMLARAAQQPDIMQHVIALGWQALWVMIIIRIGAILFRRNVMKSGPRQKAKRSWLGMGRKSAA